MNPYQDEILRYQEEAEEDFDNYDEDSLDEDIDDQYLDLMEDSYDPMDYGYSHYNRSALGKIDPNDRTLTVVVKNEGTAAAEAILFGGNEGAGQATGVTVTVEESSHNEVREESKSNPFKIQGMKMSVSNALQFDNVLKLTRRSATGSVETRVYQPRNATSPQNLNSGLIDDHSFEAEVTGQDSIRFTVNAGTTAVFTFTIKARANMANLLKGRSVAEVSRAPRTTGLPQIDLLQERNHQRRLQQRKIAQLRAKRRRLKSRR